MAQKLLSPYRCLGRLPAGTWRTSGGSVTRCGAGVDSSRIARSQFPYSNEPYHRRLLPAPFPVSGADGVLVIEDAQAIECSEKFVTTVTDVSTLQALPIEISMEPLDHDDSAGLQRVDDFRRVARDHCVHVHPHH